MADNNFETTRRSALKIAGGAVIGAAGVDGASAQPEEMEIKTDDEGNSQWILRFDSVQSVTSEEASVQEIRNAVGSAQQPAVDTLSHRADYAVTKQFWLANAILVTAEKSPAAAASELESISGVRQVHPNFEVESPEPIERQRLIPQDHGSYTYGLEQVHAPDVWEQFGTRGEGASVAVLDTGIDLDHPDLDLAEDGWAYFDENGDRVASEPFDPAGHGTHVSGTVAGETASGRDGNPHLGVAPDIDLYHAKVLDNGGTFAQILAGIQWAVAEKNVDVINMSLGGEGYFEAYIEPIQAAIAQGTVVVSSSGNDGAQTSGSPGNVYDSIAVGATDSNRNVASFSSGERVRTSRDWDDERLTGDWPINYYVPDVSAPGVSVLSAYPGGEYQQLDGTSMASPHVAGVAALLRSIDPTLGVSEIRTVLEETAVHGDGPDATPGPRYGSGIVDALSSAALVTDQNVIEGTVTYDGQLVSGATVETDFGNKAVTDADGRFSLYVADGSWTLSVDEFGVAAEGVTVPVSGGETVEQNIELQADFDVVLSDGQPDVVDQGESFDIELVTANVDSISVSLAQNSDVSEDDFTLLLNGTEVEFDVPLTQPLTDEQAVLSVQVAGSAPLGEFELVHVLEGLGESVEVTTGPTEVMADPEDAFFEIISWDGTQQVEMGANLAVEATVENTGDRTAVQPVQWWLFDPAGANVFGPEAVELRGGETFTYEFEISIPHPFLSPGAQGPHGWQTSDDLVQTTATFAGSLFRFTDVSAPEQVDYGKGMEITATLTNVGNLSGQEQATFSFDGIPVANETVSGAPEESQSVTFEFNSERVVRDLYDYSLEGPWWNPPDYMQEGSRYTDSVWIGERQVPPELEKYVNDQLVIDTEGLRAAIADWRDEEIGTELLRQIIALWRSGDPVA